MVPTHVFPFDPHFPSEERFVDVQMPKLDWHFASTAQWAAVEPHQPPELQHTVGDKFSGISGDWKADRERILTTKSTSSTCFAIGTTLSVN